MQLTASVKQAREDPQFLIQALTNSLKETFLDKNQIREILSSVEEPKHLHRQEKLAHQINVTARLSYELIDRLSKKKGPITAFAVKKFITDKPDMLDGLITTVYRKLFGKQIITENLTVLFCDELFRTLTHASEKVRMRDNIRIHQG